VYHCGSKLTDNEKVMGQLIPNTDTLSGLPVEILYGIVQDLEPDAQWRLSQCSGHYYYLIHSIRSAGNQPTVIAPSPSIDPGPLHVTPPPVRPFPTFPPFHIFGPLGEMEAENVARNAAGLPPTTAYLDSLSPFESRDVAKRRLASSNRVVATLGQAISPSIATRGMFVFKSLFSKRRLASSNSVATQAVFPLKDLPRELRMQIYKLNDGVKMYFKLQAPPLVLALVVDDKLKEEILETYQSAGNFVITAAKLDTVKQMHLNEILKFNHVSLVCSFGVTQYTDIHTSQ